MEKDIPILEGEEMWAQEAIDKSMYKVSYYMNGGTVVFKWFKTFKEATDFCVYKVPSGDVLEVKRYNNPEEFHYCAS